MSGEFVKRDGEIPLKLPYCSPRRSLLMVPTWADSRRAVSRTFEFSCRVRLAVLIVDVLSHKLFLFPSSPDSLLKPSLTSSTHWVS
jgi:hypothetical protein